MQLESILYIVYSVISITVSSILALLFWNRRNAAGAKYMALMMGSAALWGLCDFISDLSNSYLAKIYWDNASFLGVVIIPVAWLAFVMEYTKYKKCLMHRNLVLLFIIPSITLLMLWTNDLHHLMISEASFVEVGQMTILSTTYGIWFSIHAVYSYLLLLSGAILLVKKLVALPQILRSQSIIILTAILAPIVLSILFTFKAIPSYPIDTTIFSFTFTGILCFWGMFRYKLFELIPAARDAVIESMSGILMVLDNQNHIIYINPAAKKMFGGNENDFVGKHLLDFLKEWSLHFKKYENMLEAEEKISLDMKNGRKHFDLRITPLFDNRNRVMGKSFTLYDITDLEEAIDHFKEAHRAAEDANKAKSRFLATISHEIRTPLNGIIGLTELLNSIDHEEEERGYIKSVQSCASSLLDIVNDILDFSKIEAGKMELEKTDFNLRSLIDEAIKTFFHITKEKDISFVCSIDNDIPENLMGDPVRVRQILVNLIGNAFKFTEKGKIEVRVELLKCENHKTVVQFSVSDTGIGLPEDKIPKLFKSFQQVDSSTTRKYGGTGLGLAIVKNLVTLMDGSIEVKSKLGEGSRFSFIVPFEISENKDCKVASGFETDFYGKNIRVMLVDDNKTNQLLITKLLEKKKIRTDVVGNGKEAIYMLEKEAYDLILMDIQMPEMDGYETTQVIRRNETNTGKHVPVIALTANAAEEDRKICMHAGMDDYLTKPIRTEKLYECLYKYINR